MAFEWGAEKNISNIKKHGIDFTDEIEIFDYPYLNKLDKRKDYGENHWMALGKMKDIIIVLIYTKRRKNIRLILARKASKKERSIYYERIQ